jgi:hypothetical protein
MEHCLYHIYLRECPVLSQSSIKLVQFSSVQFSLFVCLFVFHSGLLSILLLNQFVVQEYEDKRVEEAQQQEKNSKDKGDSTGRVKMRREPFSFEDGMIYAYTYRAQSPVISSADS